MTFNEYQDKALAFAFYKKDDIPYNALGITGEAGEIADHVKKMLRDDEGILTEERRNSLIKEVGDVLWYLANMSKKLNISFDEVAEVNLSKLTDRKDRGVEKGSGDNR